MFHRPLSPKGPTSGEWGFGPNPKKKEKKKAFLTRHVGMVQPLRIDIGLLLSAKADND